jgi:hypothetical protein
MKSNPQFGSISVAACVSVFLSLPTFARPANPHQDQGTARTQSEPQHKKQKAGTSPGKDLGKGGEDVGKGAAKGAVSLGQRHCRSDRQSRYFAPWQRRCRSRQRRRGSR